MPRASATQTQPASSSAAPPTARNAGGLPKQAEPLGLDAEGGVEFGAGGQHRRNARRLRVGPLQGAANRGGIRNPAATTTRRRERPIMRRCDPVERRRRTGRTPNVRGLADARTDERLAVWALEQAWICAGGGPG